MKTKNLILLLFMITSISVFAQKEKISLNQLKGKITDKYGEPVINAVITIVNLNKLHQTISDSNGNYCFEKLANGFYKITIVAKGCETFYTEMLINYKKMEINIIDIVLKKYIFFELPLYAN
jgi:hypothetical protein